MHPALGRSIRLLRIACLATLACCIGAPAAVAATAPPRPAQPTLLLTTSSAGYSVAVSWAAVTDADGDHVTYRVEAEAPIGSDAVRLFAVTSNTQAILSTVVPGRSLRVRVTAVDDSSLASIPSEWATLAVPRVQTRVTASFVRSGPGAAIARCGAVRAPCADDAPDGWVVRAATAPRAFTSAAPVWIERRLRLAGDRRWRAMRTLPRDVAGSTGRALAPLGSRAFRVEQGTYCLRAVIRGSSRVVRSTSAWKCLQVRPAITIGWAGDTTLGSRAYGNPPSGGRHVFDAVASLLAAPDLMIGNYEGTLSRGGHPRCSGGAGCYIFQAPPRNASALARAGFDLMNLANNHGLDMGTAARAQTVRSLDLHGIEHAGLPGEITYVQVRETRVAVLGFAHSHGTMHLRDRHAARLLVRRAAKHADVVVVAMHAGAEGAGAAHVPFGDEYSFGENRGNTRAFTHAVVDAGADLVVGSGPHVVRGVERRRGALVFYSTGNFSGWHNFALGGLTSQSGIVHASLRFTGEIRSARWYPVRLEGPGLPVPAGRAIIRRVNALSRSDFGRSAARLTASGAVAVI